MPHLNSTEVNLVNKNQKKGVEPQRILAMLQRARRKKGETGPSQSAVYRLLEGSTYQPESAETRGRPSKLPKTMVKVASAERRKLIKKAANEYLVTWEDVHKATKAKLRSQGKLTKDSKMPSADRLARATRAETQIRARPGKRRINHTEEHREKRFEKAKNWVRYPKRFWNKIHAYIDNKKFVAARTAAQKKLLRTSKVQRHLRTPTEGSEEMFVLPKAGRMLLGVPSVDITAGVANDQIFFWQENVGNWNGAKAAAMYKKLGQALRARYGDLPFFRVVEDGDPKGFQSSKGKKAKKEQKIRSWTLPPHSPGLMPLDYSLWNEVECRTLNKNGYEKESLASYKKRLNLTAKRLPRKLVKNTVGKMKGNLAAIVKSGGGHSTLD
jgi:hypothetical protein